MTNNKDFRTKAEELRKSLDGQIWHVNPPPNHSVTLSNAAERLIESALRSAYEEGRKDGLEEAANRADELSEHYNPKEPGDLGLYRTCKCIGQQIRSLRDRSEG